MQLSIILNLVLLLMTLCVSGCQNPYIRMPNFAHPGTAAQQRADAERFDPYPDPDAGPPVIGGRPLGYTRPLNETEWSRRYVPPPLGVAQSVPIPLLPNSPVITNPFPSTVPPTYAPTYLPAAPTYPPTYSTPPAITPTYPPSLPSPTNPTQIQPRNPY